MLTVLDDIAEALGVTAKTVGQHLNRAALADMVFEMSLRFRVPQHHAATHFGISDEELRAASGRAHERHRRELQEQQRLVNDRRAGVDRKRNAPVGEPPTEEHMWCRRGRHWVHRDEMGRSSSRSSGYADWCKADFREYWRERVKARKAKP